MRRKIKTWIDEREEKSCYTLWAPFPHFLDDERKIPTFRITIWDLAEDCDITEDFMKTDPICFDWYQTIESPLQEIGPTLAFVRYEAGYLVYAKPENLKDLKAAGISIQELPESNQQSFKDVPRSVAP